MKKVMIVMFFVFAAALAYSVPVEQQTASFSDVSALVEQKVAQYGSKNVLIVLDIDDTLLTTTSDLGGNMWYEWQTGKLSVKPTEAQKVTCLFEDTISLLYELNPMKLMEPGIPARIAGWQDEGITTFALTSRGPNVRWPTERELKNQGIDFTKTALAPSGSAAAPLYRETLKREISYIKGIMMTSGLHKGEMISYILKKTGRNFSAIIFVDDSEKNIKSVLDEFAKDANTSVDLTAVFYTRFRDEREKQNKGDVLTRAQADKMDKDYDKLYATLTSLFPARKGGCVAK